MKISCLRFGENHGTQKIQEQLHIYFYEIENASKFGPDEIWDDITCFAGFWV